MVDTVHSKMILVPSFFAVEVVVGIFGCIWSIGGRLVASVC
jgi:hypothetical protein